jgi:flagellum-specific peptidoglycan hydrolase FlgJ
MKRNEFIAEVAKYAVADYKRSKVLPSLTIAQAILESGWGQSGLTRQTNNLFGIKAFVSWKGDKKTFRTREVYNGKETYIEAAFRAYPTFEGSIKDHNDLLMKSRYKKVVGTTDYKVACVEIQKAGYATDPKYAELLIRIIEQFKLQEYDRKAVGHLLSKNDADAIIKILQEKYMEGVARQDENMKKEVGRLADEVRKASGQEPKNK